VHQRVAATFRKGRVFLAGDAAHVNNSVGGLGLNGGIHDAMELADTLHQVVNQRAGQELFDRYTRRRRTLNVEFVQEQTIANKRRLEERDPAARPSALRRTPGDRRRPGQAQRVFASHLAHRQRAQGPGYRMTRRSIHEPLSENHATQP
jgi:3-(3-hydroxy-phenyl)propionate hydroxylase